MLQQPPILEKLKINLDKGKHMSNTCLISDPLTPN